MNEHVHDFLALDGEPVRYRIERNDELRVHVCVFANLCLTCGALIVEDDDLKIHRKIAKAKPSQTR